MTTQDYITFLEAELASSRRLVEALKASHAELQRTVQEMSRASDGDAWLAALTDRLRQG